MSTRTVEEQKMDSQLFQHRSEELKKYGVEMSAEEISHLSFDTYKELLESAKEEWLQANPEPSEGKELTIDQKFEGRCDTLESEGWVKHAGWYTSPDGKQEVSFMQMRGLTDKNFEALFHGKQIVEEKKEEPQTDVMHDKFAFELFISNLKQLNLPAVKMAKSQELTKNIEGLRDKMIAYIEKWMP